MEPGTNEWMIRGRFRLMGSIMKGIESVKGRNRDGYSGHRDGNKLTEKGDGEGRLMKCEGGNRYAIEKDREDVGRVINLREEGEGEGKGSEPGTGEWMTWLRQGPNTHINGLKNVHGFLTSPEIHVIYPRRTK